MTRRPLTTLAYALLGLIPQMPRTRYALMRTFQTTPLGQYSGSPGAVYPALTKLEQAGLIRGKMERASALRSRRVYRLTAKGRAALRRWLVPAVTVDDVANRTPELMLRFALMEGLLNPSEVSRFLQTMAQAIDELRCRDRAILRAPGMTLHGGLALQRGIEELLGRSAWARRARRDVTAARQDRRKS